MQQLQIYGWRYAERNVKPIISKDYTSCHAVWQQSNGATRQLSSCRYYSNNYWHNQWNNNNNNTITRRNNDMPQGYDSYYPNFLPEKSEQMLWSNYIENTYMDNMGFPTDNNYQQPEPTYHHLGNWVGESTAENKILSLDDEVSVDTKRDSWKNKSNIRDWDNLDVMYWMMYTCKMKGIQYEKVDMNNFTFNGAMLCTLTEDDFINRDQNFGKILYDSLQHFMAVGNDSMHFCTQYRNNLTQLQSTSEITPVKKEDKDKQETDCSQNSEPVQNKEPPPPSRPPKRPGPGRPPGIRSKKKPEKKCGRLWEFIRDLLKDRQYCPSLICWEDHDNGVFRFVRSEQVAKLWGTIKENPKMTYEKLSRAMRYYYKSKVLQPVIGRRLVYKFGPTAKDWRTPNPNFRM